jgi:hypothetical protein
MNYFDAYLPGNWFVLSENDYLTDQPNGVQISNPTNEVLIVYAACARGAFLHVLLTTEQLLFFEAENVPMVFFTNLPILEKGPLGGPKNVFLLRGTLEPGENEGEGIVYSAETGDPVVVEL